MGTKLPKTAPKSGDSGGVTTRRGTRATAKKNISPLGSEGSDEEETQAQKSEGPETIVIDSEQENLEEVVTRQKKTNSVEESVGDATKEKDEMDDFLTDSEAHPLTQPQRDTMSTSTVTRLESSLRQPANQPTQTDSFTEGIGFDTGVNDNKGATTTVVSLNKMSSPEGLELHNDLHSTSLSSRTTTTTMSNVGMSENKVSRGSSASLNNTFQHQRG